MTVKVSQYFGFFAFLMAIVCPLSGCSDDDSTPGEAAKDIHFNVDVWRVMEGTRATTFDNQAALQTEGQFKGAVYVVNSTTEYVCPVEVNWNSSVLKWEFSDGKHYWPASGDLDFFAYMPAEKPSYISSITYEVDGTPKPYFVCANLPMIYKNAYTDDKSVEHPEEGQVSTMKEFIYALTTGQNKAGQGVDGVTMTFKHPFARIKFQLSGSHSDITINSITFKGLKTGGTCTFDGSTSTWSSLTPSDKTENFVMTLNGDAAAFNSNPASELPIGGYSGGAHQSMDLIMVPQTFAGEIEVNATWIDWGEQLAHTVNTKLDPITWQAGCSYTYTFTIRETDLRVSTEKFTEQW